MGRANPSLNIYVHARWATHAAVVELQQQGHSIYRDSDSGFSAESIDFFIHPACTWTDEMLERGTNREGEMTDKRPYLEIAKTGARKRRKESK